MRLLAVITVGCDGRGADAARQTLSGETLLDRARRQVQEAGPDRVVVSLPDPTLVAAAHAAELEPLVRSGGQTSVEAALESALDTLDDTFSHVLAIDPLLPLRRPGRLARALSLAVCEGADCVFSCHRESSLLWRRSEMGLVPYFDPARRVDLGGGADDLPWLKEDGGFYLLRVTTFREQGSRHAGRIAPLELEPAEAVVADGSSGLSVCRALLAERAHAGAAVG